MTRTAAAASSKAALYLTVRIGQSLHALSITVIEEVLPALPVEPISSAPPYVRGIVFVRGHLVTILDGAKRMGLPSRDQLNEPQILCLRLKDQLIGMEVDEAIELVELPMEHWLPVEKIGSSTRLLTAVTDYGGEIIRIIDPEQLIVDEEK